MAALELFNEQGERNVTTNHIAAHLGISPGNLYYHFRNKEDIIQSIFELYVQVFEENFQPERDEETIGPLGVMKKHMDLVFELMWKFNFFYSNLPDILSRDESLQSKYLEVQKQVLEKVLNMLRWLNQSGKTRIPEENLEDLAHSIKLITVFWISYQRTQSPQTKITRGVVYQGVLKVFSLFKSYITEETRAEFEQIEQGYRELAAQEA